MSGRRRLRDDRGSMIPLVLGFLLITTMLLTVVTDVGSMWLARRSLQATLDGAALAGSRAVDLQAIYSGRSRGPLLLDQAAAVGAVRGFIAQSPSAHQLGSVQIMHITISGATVTVRGQISIHPPFLSLLKSGQVHIQAQASAQTIAG